MSAKHPEASAPINVLLMFREHVIPRYKELQGELVKLARREQEVRLEMSKLERHALIEELTITPPESVFIPATPAPETTV